MLKLPIGLRRCHSIGVAERHIYSRSTNPSLKRPTIAQFSRASRRLKVAMVMRLLMFDAAVGRLRKAREVQPRKYPNASGMFVLVVAAGGRTIDFVRLIAPAAAVLTDTPRTAFAVFHDALFGCSLGLQYSVSCDLSDSLFDRSFDLLRGAPDLVVIHCSPLSFVPTAANWQRPASSVRRIVFPTSNYDKSLSVPSGSLVLVPIW